uniref:non-specific serine/threonine protein kinase n=1 Tax=Kalanchoe fedtschenkoi TaxID=63787 RepID=A0A7N0TNX9_KALFE
MGNHLVSLASILFLGVFASATYSKCNWDGYFDCRDVKNITYPFWTKSFTQENCSLNPGPEEFELLNCDRSPSITIQDQIFRVRNISMQNKTMRLSLPRGEWPWRSKNSICQPKSSPHNVMVNQMLSKRLVFSSTVHVFSSCENLVKSPPSLLHFKCGWSDWFFWGEEMKPPPHEAVNSCKIHIEVAVMNRTTLDNLSGGNSGQRLLDELLSALDAGFEVHFPEPSPSEYEDNAKTGLSDVERKLIIGFGVGGGTVLIMCAAFFIYLRYRKAICDPSSYYTRNISSDPSSITDHEKMGAQYGVKFFTYEELEKATDNFNQNMEIGDGGFGTVYRGVLQDGRIVAVKRLYENNYKRVEQFLNEVEILTRLRHRNLVTLYGCTSRHSRELLLVYEYISNGTVGDHLHGRKVKPGSLSWQTRLKIAVETASALKYLHASDIIHRDVKTNNILLDDYFNVKVADFGLSRLFPLHVTHVSTAPQGTPGYVDPEYHQCYQLTDKSDVYSFGVVLVELISSKPAVDITRHRHEINLSNMAINKIQNDALHELVDPALGYDKDPNAQKMIAAVAELAFQCLQSDKDLRPSMQEVLDILTRIQCGDEEKAEELEILSDEFVLLKSGSLPLSPDSVTVKWVSNSTAAN